MNEQHPSPVADAATTRPRHTRIAALGIAAAVLLTAGAGAGAWAATTSGTTSTETAAQGGAWSGSGSPGGGSGTQGSAGEAFGGRGLGGQGYGSPSAEGSSSGSTTVDSAEADAQQIRGVVTITTELGYRSGEAAGTGIVLTSDGRILTNNHVISGATEIEVTDETTGRAYTAEVVGTDASEDVAVLQLRGASDLTTAEIATDDAALGDDVTAVGNAGGTGTLTAAEGSVTGLDERITTQSEANAEGETLDGLIETSADVVSGDSGGPLKDADGAVIGIDTAASSGGSDVTGYAIPIATAMDVVEQILAGDETEGVTIGYPAFLGVSLAEDRGDGAVVGGALEGTPAADAGLAAGDVITDVDGEAIDAADGLTAAIGRHEPGDRVSITWTTADGGSESATVVLTEGPAD